MLRSHFAQALGVAVVGLAVLAAVPPSAGAAASAYHVQTRVGDRSVIYHDAFSPAVAHATDQQLGFKTHWEGLVDLTLPNSPIEWTRVKDAVVGAPVAGIGSIPAVVGPAAPERTRPARGSHSGLTPSTCNYSGGIKLWYASTETGDCIRYTGNGSQSLAGVNYPYGPANEYVDHSQAFSSFGSTGSGHLACRTDWYYGSNHDYGNLFNASGSQCDGTQGNVYVLYVS